MKTSFKMGLQVVWKKFSGVLLLIVRYKFSDLGIPVQSYVPPNIS